METPAPTAVGRPSQLGTLGGGVPSQEVRYVAADARGRGRARDRIGQVPSLWERCQRTPGHTSVGGSFPIQPGRPRARRVAGRSRGTKQIACLGPTADRLERRGRRVDELHAQAGRTGRTRRRRRWRCGWSRHEQEDKSHDCGHGHHGRERHIEGLRAPPSRRGGISHLIEGQSDGCATLGHPDDQVPDFLLGGSEWVLNVFGHRVPPFRRRHRRGRVRPPALFCLGTATSGRCLLGPRARGRRRPR